MHAASAARMTSLTVFIKFSALPTNISDASTSADSSRVKQIVLVGGMVGW